MQLFFNLLTINKSLTGRIFKAYRPSHGPHLPAPGLAWGKRALFDNTITKRFWFVCLICKISNYLVLKQSIKFPKTEKFSFGRKICFDECLLDQVIGKQIWSKEVLGATLCCGKGTRNLIRTFWSCRQINWLQLDAFRNADKLVGQAGYNKTALQVSEKTWKLNKKVGTVA